MPDLNFHVEGVEAVPHAAVPILNFKLKIDQADGRTPIHTVALRCQLRIEPARRKYSADQQQRLMDLFGQASQWSQTLRPMLWTHASAMVPAFALGTCADLPVPCTYDFNVAATKYFDALGDDGDIPLCLLFSGTIFYESESGALQAVPISWEKEANFRLPARIWREMMDQHHPNTAWLRIGKETFDRLRQFKTRAGHVTWERAIDDLLEAAQAKVPG
jgi:hypothetical protein